jgi:histidine phosphotransferase ChpT
MSTELDIRVVELLCSRLCHELVSPVGAINNGVELIEEMGAEMADEAIGLIAHSAGQASRRLRLLRLAYGSPGSGNSAMTDAAQAAEAYFTGAKVRLDWPGDRLDSPVARRPGVPKVLLNLVVVADEALAYGGAISVESGAGGTPVVVATGRGAALRPDVAEALAGTPAIEALTPRTVHAYATGRFAAFFGLLITPRQDGPERLALHIEP